MDLSFLLGREIIADDPRLWGRGQHTRKCSYTVIEAYPCYVRAMRICENGQEIYQCFDLGDLVRMGALKSVGADLPTEKRRWMK